MISLLRATTRTTPTTSRGSGRMTVKMLGPAAGRRPGRLAGPRSDRPGAGSFQLPRRPSQARRATWQQGRPMKVGESVFAIGNPHDLGWSHTQGVISQLRTQDFDAAPGPRHPDPGGDQPGQQRRRPLRPARLPAGHQHLDRRQERQRGDRLRHRARQPARAGPAASSSQQPEKLPSNASETPSRARLRPREPDDEHGSAATAPG